MNILGNGDDQEIQEDREFSPIMHGQSFTTIEKITMFKSRPGVSKSCDQPGRGLHTSTHLPFGFIYLSISLYIYLSVCSLNQSLAYSNISTFNYVFI
jgi:hypothetical protein